MDDEIGYHSSRAMAEIEQARRCPDAQAARCHLQLAEQHLARLRSLSRREQAVPSACFPGAAATATA